MREANATFGMRLVGGGTITRTASATLVQAVRVASRRMRSLDFKPPSPTCCTYP